MLNLTGYPIMLLLLSVLAFWAAAWIGAFWRSRQGSLGEETRQFFAIILGASLTLLGLIIAFTFSMAVSRYDQRKRCEEEEANVIGTEYFRANLLPVADAGKIRALLKSYLDERVLYYETRNADELRRINSRTAQLETDLWSEASLSVATLPPPLSTFVLGGMNDVLNSQSYTQAAWWNRIPVAAWILLICIAIFCNLLIGYDAPGRRAFFLLILPIALSISLFLIADIDTPRRGVIRVHPQNLRSLAESLHSQ